MPVRFTFFLSLLCLLLASCGSSKKAASRGKTSKEDVLTKYSTLLGAKLSPASEPVYQLVNEWVGAPYKYAGCSSDGSDCSGLCYTFYKELYNKELPRRSHDMHIKSKKVKESKLEEGDLVFFAISKKNSATHVGFFLTNGYFIHSSSSRGVVISHLDEDYYRKHFLSAGRFR